VSQRTPVRNGNRSVTEDTNKKR